MKNLLTIAIPIYNGEYTIAETLDSIIPQILENSFIEILICDNCSIDNTASICQGYVNKYDFISYNLNPTNIGFDGNIDQLIKLAMTDYVWFLGDDDEIESGGLKYIIDILRKPTIYAGLIVNYALIDRRLNKVVCERVVKHFQDIEFCNSNMLLDKLGLAPNFLSSVIINKKFYDHSAMSIFIGYQWFHFMVFLRIVEFGKSYFVSHPYVLNKGIEINGPNFANEGGVSISILLDLLEHIQNLNPIYYNDKVKKKVISQSFHFFYRKVASARMYGAKFEVAILKRLLSLYYYKPHLYLIIFPLYFLPRSLYMMTYSIRNFIKYR